MLLWTIGVPVTDYFCGECMKRLVTVAVSARSLIGVFNFPARPREIGLPDPRSGHEAGCPDVAAHSQRGSSARVPNGQLVFAMRLFLMCSVFWFGFVTSVDAKEKSRLVLLPVWGEGIGEIDRDLYRKRLATVWSDRYEVFSGAEVEKKLENGLNQPCDAEECLKKIAIAFQANLIGRGSITRVVDDYYVLVEIRDVITGKVEFSDVRVCSGCGAAALTQTVNAAACGGASDCRAASGSLLASLKPVEVRHSGDGDSDVGMLILDSAPSGADVFLGGVKIGQTPYQNPALKSGQTLQLALKRAGYQARNVDLVVKGGNNEMTLELAPAVGGLIVSSTPVGAAVLLDGQEVGKTPWRTDQLTIGKHLISLRLYMYAPVENHVVEVRDGLTTTKNFNLVLRFGILEIAGSDNTLTVFDSRGRVVRRGRGRGTNFFAQFAREATWPVTYTLDPGRYSVELSRAGYESRRIDVDLDDGQHVRIGVDQTSLRRLEGTLIIRTDPLFRGAEGFVNDRSIGAVPAKLTLPPGNHEVRVVSGGLSAEQTAAVVDRGTTVASVKLGPFPPTPWRANGNCPACPEMVEIPDGRFSRGDSMVSVPSFLLARTEVTQAQWRAVMGNNPSRFSQCDDCPVENVSWDEIRDWLKKIRMLTGEPWRLPSEAEWEYACMAGETHRNCGGDDLDSVGWYGANSGSKTHPVGQKKANAFGLYDMSGNVMEWVQDCWNDAYLDAPSDGSAWLSGECQKRVRRGGSWSYGTGGPKSRDWSLAAARSSLIGFRVARSVYASAVPKRDVRLPR